MPDITLGLYGACRDLHPEPALRLALPDGATVADLRRALPAHFSAASSAKAHALISASAFATDQALLRDTDPLPEDGQLSILPPVSGG